MKHFRYYILLWLCFISLLGCRKQTDWTEHYKDKSKDPFGLFILHNEAEELFDNKEVIYLRKNIYDYLYDTYFEEDYSFNYVCIKNDINKISQAGLMELLLNVEEGSIAFFSLGYFSEYLESELNFEIENMGSLAAFIKNDSLYGAQQKRGHMKFMNKDFDNSSFFYDRNMSLNYFSNYDSNTSVVLGTNTFDGKEQPVFLKVYYGKGIVYLHTEPIAFTNYNLLKDNYEYAEQALSYLPSNDIIWDTQTRNSRLDRQSSDGSGSRSNPDSGSVFQFFLDNPSLKWFLYLMFSGLIVFLLFNARRRQRPIPVIDPPKNSTLEFTHTISNLYLLNKNHQNLADKKIQYFLEKVRTRYFLDTSNLNKDFIEKLALKSGNDLQSTEYLIRTILYTNGKSNCSADELMELNKLIDNFLKRK